MASFSLSETCYDSMDYFNSWNFLFPSIPILILSFVLSAFSHILSSFLCLFCFGSPCIRWGPSWSSSLPTCAIFLCTYTTQSTLYHLWWLPDFFIPRIFSFPGSRPIPPTIPSMFPLWSKLQENMSTIRSNIWLPRCIPTPLFLI